MRQYIPNAEMDMLMKPSPVSQNISSMCMCNPFLLCLNFVRIYQSV